MAKYVAIDRGFFTKEPKIASINKILLIETSPLAKLYFWVFSSGKDYIKVMGISDSETTTAGEFLTCFFASVNS